MENALQTGALDGVEVDATSSQKPTSSTFQDVKAMVLTPGGIATTLVIVALISAFWHLFSAMPEYWFQTDQYYTHGPIIPLLAAYIIWDRRAAISAAMPKSEKASKIISWLAVFFLIPPLYLDYIGTRTDMLTVLSTMFTFSLVLAIVALWGYAKAWKALPGLLYIFLAFPFGRGFLDRLTNPLQLVSTESAFQVLSVLGFDPVKPNANQIYVGTYSLYVAAACAGLGMALSVFAFVVLFAIIARLKWWGYAILLGSWIPLVILINGIRIAMIAIVGDYYGVQAAASFHDWSGYISLGLMFFILMKITRALGWK